MIIHRINPPTKRSSPCSRRLEYKNPKSRAEPGSNKKEAPRFVSSLIEGYKSKHFFGTRGGRRKAN